MTASVRAEVDLLIRAERAVLPGGVIRPAAIGVSGGRIRSVSALDDPAPARAILDARGLVVLPGLVDTHVHVNEPGRTEWEGFASATAAAAAGGVTTLVDMPLNSVPATTTRQALAAKQASAEGSLAVDVAFWGGVIPGNHDELAALWVFGVAGFKCFLAPSGVSEFPHVGEEDLERAMPALAPTELPLLVHAELPRELERAAAAVRGAAPRRYATWLDSRPESAEVEAIRLVAALAERMGSRIHIVHVAGAAAIAEIAAARARGISISAETCPHYLTFCAEEIPDGATPFKCAPPIRERRHREALWAALLAGTLDLVATDHSPCPPAMKRLDDGDFMAAWGGIASLQLGFPAVWTEARARGIELGRVADWMSAAPARLAGLDGCKGSIAPGQDADLVFFDPEAEWTVEGARLRHRHPVTPYEGRRLRGRVEQVLLRGAPAYRSGEWVEPPAGRMLKVRNDHL
jgi:allantoinase